MEARHHREADSPRRAGSLERPQSRVSGPGRRVQSFQERSGRVREASEAGRPREPGSLDGRGHLKTSASPKEPVFCGGRRRIRRYSEKPGRAGADVSVSHLVEVVRSSRLDVFLLLEFRKRRNTNQGKSDGWHIQGVFLDAAVSRRSCARLWSMGDPDHEDTIRRILRIQLFLLPLCCPSPRETSPEMVPGVMLICTAAFPRQRPPLASRSRAFSQ